MGKRILGIDVGISSVGWGVLDLESWEVIGAGVRLFNEGSSELNADRRGFRSQRRLLRRRKHRVERLKQCLIKFRVISSADCATNTRENPYLIRVRGLREKLTPHELFVALRHIAKHRGLAHVNIIMDDEETEKEQGEIKQQLIENQEHLKGRYICELQLERLQSGERKVRGTHNYFYTDDYIREVKQILSHFNLSKEVIGKICEIIAGRRMYYDGPGSEKSPTPYGQWFYDEHGVKQHIGMIEKMKGRCSIYLTEYRAPRSSFTAELFNLLNQLNNLLYGDNQKLTLEQKRNFISQYALKSTETGLPKRLSRFLGVPLEMIYGFPTKKNDQVFLSPLEKTKVVLSILRTADPLNQVGDAQLLDDIAQILTDEKEEKRRIEKLNALNHTLLTQSSIQELTQLSKLSGYHRLSLKAMRDMLPELWETNKNHIQILTHHGSKLMVNGLTAYSTARNIPFQSEDILSSVARRAQREAVKVINVARRCYGEFDSIVIEMPRDKNTAEQRKRIREIQKNNEDVKKRVEEILGKKDINASLMLKVQLYQEQQGKCIYSGQPIDLRLLQTDDRAYEIDHILPLSISFDDSRANKVLCLAGENQKKGQRSPFAYFSSGQAQCSYEAFKAQVLETYKGGTYAKKRQLLLCEEDITRYENQKKFIERNLVDTRYASRSLLNTVQQFFRSQNIQTTVHIVRGAVTHGFRVRAGIRKDRDEDFSHHAIDALIIAGIKKLNLFDHALRVELQSVNGEAVAVDRKTGEVFQMDDDQYFDKRYIQFLKTLRDCEKKFIHYSHKVDRKPNRALSDQTIYGVRLIAGEERTIEKYKDIYGDAGKRVAELFRAHKADTLLMFTYDRPTWDILARIVKNYPEAENPFAEYYKEHGYIRKRGTMKGPIIRSLRRNKEKLGMHQDISAKYPRKPNGAKVVKLQMQPYRVDIYRETSGRYRFIRLCHHHLRLTKTGYTIDAGFYAAEKNRRGIGEDAIFQFSLYKNDLFGFVTRDKAEKIVRYNGGSGEKFEWKPLDRSRGEKTQEFLSIGPSIQRLTKYQTDVLGRLYRVQREACTLEMPVLQ